MRTIGDYYEEHRKEAERLWKLIDEVKEKDPKNYDLLRHLEAQLELALYVGD